MESPIRSNLKFEMEKNLYIYEYLKGILKRLENNEKISILETEKIRYYSTIKLN